MNEITSVQSLADDGDFAMSEKVDLLFAAMVEAQAADLNAAPKSVNPQFKSKYADLSTIWDAIRGPLAENGLCVLQFPSANGNKVSVRTMLGHKSGQWIASTASATALGQDPQKIGSAITYLKRYGLSAMVGVAADKDDDGNAASTRDEAPSGFTPRSTQPAPARPLPSRTQPAAAANSNAAPETLSFQRPNGEVVVLRAGEGGMTLPRAYFNAVEETARRATTERSLNDWWEKNSEAQSIVDRHWPPASKAAQEAVTKRKAELADFPGTADSTRKAAVNA